MSAAPDRGMTTRMVRRTRTSVGGTTRLGRREPHVTWLRTVFVVAFVALGLGVAGVVRAALASTPGAAATAGVVTALLGTGLCGATAWRVRPTVAKAPRPRLAPFEAWRATVAALAAAAVLISIAGLARAALAGAGTAFQVSAVLVSVMAGIATATLFRVPVRAVAAVRSTARGQHEAWLALLKGASLASLALALVSLVRAAGRGPVGLQAVATGASMWACVVLCAVETEARAPSGQQHATRPEPSALPSVPDPVAAGVA